MITVSWFVAKHLLSVVTYFVYRLTSAISEKLNSGIATMQKRASSHHNRDPFKLAVTLHCIGRDPYSGRTLHPRLKYI